MPLLLNIEVGGAGVWDLTLTTHLLASSLAWCKIVSIHRMCLQITVGRLRCLNIYQSAECMPYTAAAQDQAQENRVRPNFF